MTDQPSNAPTDLKDMGDQAVPTDARDDASAAAILSDSRLEDMPGGGGLGGGDAAGGANAPTGGASPNMPADGNVSAGDAGAAREAIRRSTDETAR